MSESSPQPSPSPAARHPNLDHHRAFFDTFALLNTPDFLTAFERVTAPEVVFAIPGRHALAGLHRGREAVLGTFGRIFALTGGTFRPEMRGVAAADDFTATRTVLRASRPDGRQLDVGAVEVHEFDPAGRVRAVRLFVEDTAALDAFWA